MNALHPIIANDDEQIDADQRFHDGIMEFIRDAVGFVTSIRFYAGFYAGCLATVVLAAVWGWLS